MTRRTMVLLAAACTIAWAGPRAVVAQAAPAVAVDRRGNPPEALVSLRNLLDEGRFLSALESGFPLYVEYSVSVREPRTLWDRTVAHLSWEYVVLRDPVREEFTVETPEGTERLRGREALHDRVAQVYVVGLMDPGWRGTFYYEADVTVRTLSDEDVDEAFAWLYGQGEEDARRRAPGPLSRLARKVLVGVAPLPRLNLKGRSEQFEVR